MCSSPSSPKVPPPPPPPPTRADFASKQGIKQKKKTLGRAGQQSTILTNPLGMEEKANIQQKTLLGQ